jgi:hypothetical protein
MGTDFLTKRFEGNLTASQVRELVVEKIRNSCENNHRNEDYDGYSGTWGEASAHCNTHDRIFESESEAEEWLSNTAQKWEGAEAVRYRTSPQVPSEKQAAYKAEREKAAAASKKLQALKAKQDKIKASFAAVAEDVKKIKIQINIQHSKSTSNLFKCSGCGSSIAKKFIKTTDANSLGTASLNDMREEGYNHLLTSSVPHCPLCAGNLTTIKTAGLKAKIEKLNALGKAFYAAAAEMKEAQAAIDEKLLKKYKAASGYIWIAAVWASC